MDAGDCDEGASLRLVWVGTGEVLDAGIEMAVVDMRLTEVVEVKNEDSLDTMSSVTVVTSSEVASVWSPDEEASTKKNSV